VVHEVADALEKGRRVAARAAQRPFECRPAAGLRKLQLLARAVDLFPDPRALLGGHRVARHLDRAEAGGLHQRLGAGRNDGERREQRSREPRAPHGYSTPAFMRYMAWSAVAMSEAGSRAWSG
jgi:hypothetical protein